MIRPVHDRICIRKEPQAPLMVGGILIPEVCERTPRFAPTIYGEVLGVGARVKHAKVGQRVLLKIYAGDDWYFRGEHLTIIRERDLIGLAL